jgi:type III secretion protein J
MRLFFMLAIAALCAGCQDVLYSKLTEQQANEVVAALAEARIKSSKERVDENSWKISVGSSNLGEALVFLRDRGLPSHKAPTIADVFKKEGMISTPLEERARFAFAVQEDIAATLRKIDGVVDARVHVVIPQNDPLSDRVVPASASVFLRHRALLDVELLAPKIKSLVLSGVQGLEYRNISLFALPVDAQLGNGKILAGAKDLASIAPPVFVAGSASSIISPGTNSGSSEQEPPYLAGPRLYETAIPTVGLGALVLILGGAGFVGALSKRRNQDGPSTADELPSKLVMRDSRNAATNRSRLSEVGTKQQILSNGSNP